MTTTEKLGWLIVTIGLLVAVAAIIITPILDKADDSKDEIEDIKFESGSGTSSFNMPKDHIVLADGSKVVWTA